MHIKLHPSTHCGLVIQSSDTCITSWILVNIGLGTDLLPDGTQPLPEPMLINHRWERVAFTWGQFHRNDIYLWYNFENDSLKITATSLRGQWVKRMLSGEIEVSLLLGGRLLRTSENLRYYQQWLRSWPNENWLGTVRISSFYTFLQIVKYTYLSVNIRNYT